MDTLEIVIIAVVAVLGLLALGGAAVVRRRRDAGAERFSRDLEQVNRDLAIAHAADRGWDPATVEAAAREAFAERFPGVEPAAVELVQVIDPPGTDEDKAVFNVVADGGAHRVTLGRRSGQWVPETVD
ncbi:MAG: hypothetical protein QOE86_979 [Solirubrobacteraceae bacterium]|nr:hypothetical protein [Solirubrobacteraceae bacterium]